MNRMASGFQCLNRLSTGQERHTSSDLKISSRTSAEFSFFGTPTVRNAGADVDQDVDFDGALHVDLHFDLNVDLNVELYFDLNDDAKVGVNIERIDGPAISLHL